MRVHTIAVLVLATIAILLSVSFVSGLRTTAPSDPAHLIYMPLINAAAPQAVLTEPITATPTAIATATDVSPTQTPAVPMVPAFKHIFVIVMENKEATRIVGNPAAPFINALAQQYGRAAAFYGTWHPSLPNYLALTGGDTFGIEGDCTDCFVNATNLVDQLEASGKSWKAYMESMPQPCFVGDAGNLYAQRHNPFIYYDDVRNDPARCNNVVPFKQFSTDLATNALPDFVWITPNLCNDMHDCAVETGDVWLQTWVAQILASPAWQDDGALFITFDEGDTSAGCCTYAAGGQIDTLVISPLGRPGFVSSVAYDHYSLLRTIEEAWGMPPLRKAACDCSPPMVDFFRTGGY
ncbi:MAG TPA: alkaline phosphatase family protein [Roseiflexaceae bacterium]|nr:alkaline phosphatase family protein [Roseiflexaceae bacterium]